MILLNSMNRDGLLLKVKNRLLVESIWQWWLNSLNSRIFITVLSIVEPQMHTIFIKRFRIAWHAIFWIIVLLFYTLYFGNESKEYMRILIFVVPLLVITLSTTYFTGYYLFPKFLVSGQYRKLIFYLALTFIIALWLESVTVMGMLALSLNLWGEVFDHTALNFVFLVVGMFFVIVIALAVKLLKMWFEKQQAAQVLASEKLEAELKLLKSQIHPHFLFNTLNNIYSLALKKADSTPDMILKLSDILDYLLYECDVPYVILGKEIDLIHNYTDLEKIRYGSRLQLAMDVQVPTDEIKIAPLILLPFIENAFKHGAAGKRDQVHISVYLKVENNRLIFKVENDKAEKESKALSHGVGLKNVRKRLELVYGEHYDLKIQDGENHYQVILQIELL
ncbi:MAG: histidine kinase [Bacteroidetes bacterium]|nr:histidine kinase [Bacteroidota bacterium]